MICVCRVVVAASKDMRHDDVEPEATKGDEDARSLQALPRYRSLPASTGPTAPQSRSFKLSSDSSPG